MLQTNKFVILCMLLAMTGCSFIPTGSDRIEHADELAAAKGWRSQLIRTSDFSLQSYTPASFNERSSVLRVFIEGDGLAWISRSRPSSDPTPLNPIALELALANTDANAAYLARPCQFNGRDDAKCNRNDWTSGRFSRSVIDSMDQAVDELKGQSAAESLELVGFSGGGAVALLLAAQRNDVTKVITVAGNLKIDRWTDFHRISLLKDSLNPADYIQQLSTVEQVHYVGELDEVIPPLLVEEFVSLLGSTAPVKMIVVDGFDHHCCWKDYQLDD